MVPGTVGVIRTRFYFWSFLIAGVIGTISGCVSLLCMMGREEDVGLLLAVISLPFSIFYLILLLTFVYKAWRVLQPFAVRTTPGKAVGFLFIPLFNYYWMFRVIWGLARDFNRIVRRHNLSIRPAPEGVALAYCILVPVGAVAAYVPILNPLVPLTSLALFLVFVSRVGNGLNALASRVPLAVTVGSRCPKCGTPSEPGASFCSHCGTALTPPGMVCPRCGKTNAPTAAFCVQCGSAFGLPTAPPPREEKAQPVPQPPQAAPLPSAAAPRTGRKGTAILVTVIVLAVVAAAVIYHSYAVRGSSMVLSPDRYYARNGTFSLLPPEGWRVAEEDDREVVFAPGPDAPCSGPHSRLKVWRGTASLVAGTRQYVDVMTELRAVEQNFFRGDVARRGTLEIETGETCAYAVFNNRVTKRMVEEDGGAEDAVFALGMPLSTILGLTGKEPVRINIDLRAPTLSSEALEHLFKSVAQSIRQEKGPVSRAPDERPQPAVTRPPDVSPVTRPETPLAGRIAFVTNVDGNLDICSMKPDGSDVRRLTDDPARDAEPKWSPDGTRIAFKSRRDGNDEIYVMNADGSNPVNVTRNPATDEDCSWSPDSTEMCFASDRDGNFEIYLMRADGANVRRLTANPSKDLSPCLSPDGLSIVFISQREGRDGIYVMNSDGTGVRPLPSTGGNPRWTPDGKSIVFHHATDGNMDIWMINADGTGLKRLTRSPEAEALPSSSPDGAMVAYTVMPGRSGGFGMRSAIFVMRADGSEPTRVTPEDKFCYSPSWSCAAVPETPATRPPAPPQEKWDANLARLREQGLDVVFVFDSTGSMGGIILEVKSRIRQLMKVVNYLVPNARLGLVTYRDRKKYDLDDYEYTVKFIPLQEGNRGGLDKLQRFLREIEASGGGDIPEAVLDGVQAAIEKAGWTPGAKKIVIVLGDAPPRPEDDGLSKMYDVCKKWKASGGVISCIDTNGGSKLMQEFRQMAADGGGEATFLNDERAIVKQIVVFIFGSKWETEIDKVYNSVLKGPEDTVVGE